ncbi:uncharacterized protein LOC128863598 [Anastrepha ludens]|uniref:uncharacterized protein LOC128863598 n=1 Tax=Anastrepha ludens TaxID=28586 RepID=UPI0023B0928F|nr:uncharacterized protein LOC128863598 [Anastrepha ludens]
MSCINYPSNYRVIMESNAPSNVDQFPTDARPLSSVQCSCQRSFQQPNHQLHQQQQQHQAYQQQHQSHQQTPALQLGTCLHHQAEEQASAKSQSSPQESQNSQASTGTSAGPFGKSYYQRSTSELGGQLSYRCPFEISISSAHSSSKPSYEIRLPSGMATISCPGRNSTSDEEFYSLSSASSEQDDCMPRSKPKYKKESAAKSKFMDCDCDFASPLEKNSPNAFTSPPRNVAILELLREIVQLVNQADESGTGCGCGVASTKIRNIGALGSEEAAADNGPFGSEFKITFNPNRKGSSPNASCAQKEMSEPQPLGEPISIPLQLPCNLIITPNLLTCAPCPHAPIAAAQTPGQLQTAAQSAEPCKPTAKPHTKEATAKDFCSSKTMPCSCIGDLELIEEIAAFALAADCKTRTEPSSQACETNDQFGAGATFEPSSMVCNKACPEECICNQPCICPVHGFYMPAATHGESSAARDCSQTIDEEECEYMDGEGTGIVTEPSQSKTHMFTAPSATTNGSRKSSECTCCHCQAMRDKQHCTTIATTEQSLNKSSCSELKFFIDSIIMDLDAMEKARRKKQAEQNITPTRARTCPRQSFPVTITEVSDLGATSLYVKWVIHDCYGIAGYEIYVDGYLTNRYFHCNHEAAVVCDVDVTKAHKVVLVAQPKQVDCNCGDSTENRCKELMRKSDADKMNETAESTAALWMPSIYLYDPCDKKDVPPMNRGIV